MSDAALLTCSGRAAFGPCQRAPLYEVFRAEGRTPRRSYACGVHVSWVLADLTWPGVRVDVTRLPAKPAKRGAS